MYIEVLESMYVVCMCCSTVAGDIVVHHLAVHHLTAVLQFSSALRKTIQRSKTI